MSVKSIDDWTQRIIMMHVEKICSTMYSNLTLKKPTLDYFYQKFQKVQGKWFEKGKFVRGGIGFLYNTLYLKIVSTVV